MYRSAMLVLVPLFALCLLLMLPAAAQPASVPPPIVTPPFPDKLHVSIHCMLDYRDVVTMYGMPGYQVVALHDDPEAGRLGEIQFKEGDIIIGVGYYAATPMDRLDVLINMAYAEDHRTIQVLDGETGDLRLLEF
jgi:hypothetical protein